MSNWSEFGSMRTFIFFSSSCTLPLSQSNTEYSIQNRFRTLRIDSVSLEKEWRCIFFLIPTPDKTYNKVLNKKKTIWWVSPCKFHIRLKLIVLLCLKVTFVWSVIHAFLLTIYLLPMKFCYNFLMFTTWN